ncbi:hypothetical protein [Streptoalloteichus hindustanus]|uniref:NanT5 n=1 Tax=Streptoalloteichus hindustanus TaxID=2017 RepID=A0A1M5CG08_STRHI|nr:hypothetical protein [Streptoalloteichus hindustanus]SHF53606.1 hypothetical protein SAMN05444320_1049 [Streptoalloteichus hindustanus]
MPSPDAVRIADQLRRQQTWAAIVITLAVLFALQFPTVLAHRHHYRPVEGQFLALAVFAATTGWVAVTTWRGRSPGRWRWPLVAVTLAASVIATATVAPDQYLGIPHWSYGTVGWPLTVLVVDRGVGVLAGLLVVHFAVSAVQVAAVGEVAVTLGGALQQSLITSVFQLAVGYGATLLDRIAGTAASAARKEEELRTAEAVREQVHADRKKRYATLARTTMPLLDGLASGALDPADREVRRACAVEGARMRRLFAENAEVDDPLTHELEACVDLAERRGISVQFLTYGERGPVPTATRRLLTEPAVVALASAETAARVTVVGMGDSVTVSVVADVPEDVIPAVRTSEINTSIVCEDGRVWVKTTWTPAR